jgi:hypothetical protein
MEQTSNNVMDGIFGFDTLTDLASRSAVGLVVI